MSTQAPTVSQIEKAAAAIQIGEAMARSVGYAAAKRAGNATGRAWTMWSGIGRAACEYHHGDRSRALDQLETLKGMASQ